MKWKSYIHPTITALLCIVCVLQWYALFCVHDEVKELQRDFVALQKKDEELMRWIRENLPEKRVERPNKAPEPTATSVTPPAAAGVAPAASVAHL